MSSPPPLEAGIPVLTEIIPSPPPQSAPDVAPVPPSPPPEPEEDVATLEQRATAIFNEGQWERLEREVRERVLRQVLDRIDFVLEQRVRDCLADVLQTAVEKLAADIKGGLHHSIREVVTRAVSQEITKLQGTKK
ncbi:MAG TPA: hypothetical protein VFF81_09315 [Noviherbaspirillum sp.]|nr:hypothetical protein [Noviherbaspirillum sp.]